MPADWKAHCPIDEDEDPVLRQAWRGGWEYRIEHGAGKPDKETVLNVMGRPSLLSFWMQGFPQPTLISVLTRFTAPMPGLSYPFVFECPHCGRETTVKRVDALSAHPDPDSLEAIDVVLAAQGWVKCTGGRCCPDCASEVE